MKERDHQNPLWHSKMCSVTKFNGNDVCNYPYDKSHYKKLSQRRSRAQPSFLIFDREWNVLPIFFWGQHDTRQSCRVYVAYCPQNGLYSPCASSCCLPTPPYENYQIGTGAVPSNGNGVLPINGAVPNIGGGATPNYPGPVPPYIIGEGGRPFFSYQVPQWKTSKFVQF